ncbi:ABC transporter substrate-binding protein [Streptomyces sp. YGL11-2]|uniref:ABC transporter substrate-binding protein n=1 Tax=Streptomyces sp. YGL11-2 TaxID=3414028 RepID=UPI003CF963F6
MKRIVALAATTCALGLLTTACGGSGSSSSAAPSGATASDLHLPDLHGQHLEVAAVWTGPEQKNFMKVIERFDQLTGAKTDFVPTGDNVSTFLGTKIQGGGAPDVAFLPQPGVLAQFAKSGWLKPAEAAVEKQLKSNYSTGWQNLGAYQGKQYGVYFKAADKSTVWYNTKAFSTAGISSPPATWSEFLKDAQTISDSGTPPVSVGGADGWTLTDWFENIYLSQAGPAKYDQLTKHQIKWTDPSVGKALTTLGQLFGKPTLLAGGTRGAVATEFPASVDQTFADPAKAAMVYEGDFVATNITSDTKAKIGTDAKVFPFPKADGGQAPMVVGGDVAVALKSSKGAQALLTYLASTDAARTEVKQGGFISPNKSLDLSAYPDATEQSLAKSLTAAGDNFRFDMSDQAPAAFGGTKGQGEWKDLQDFLAAPSDVAGAQSKLETDAAAAFANAG